MAGDEATGDKQSRFDAYYEVLGIPPHEQPPDHYRLLGLQRFESDAIIIRVAAERQTAYLQTYKLGPQSELSQRLLNEIARAKVCLLDPARKTEYDEKLARTPRAQPVPPVSPAYLEGAEPPLQMDAIVDDVFDPILRPAKKRSKSARFQPPARGRDKKRGLGWGAALLLCLICFLAVMLVVVLSNIKHMKPPADEETPAVRPPAEPKSEPETAPRRRTRTTSLPRVSDVLPTESTKRKPENTPLAPETVRWADASQPVEMGPVKIKIDSVAVEDIRLESTDLTSLERLPAKPMLRIRVLVENTSPDNIIPFAGWNGGGDLIGQGAGLLGGEAAEAVKAATATTKLTDNRSNAYPQTPSLLLSGHAITIGKGNSVRPGETRHSDLVYPAPLATIEYLRLELPGVAFGTTEAARFQIPRSKIIFPSAPPASKEQPPEPAIDRITEIPLPSREAFVLACLQRPKPEEIRSQFKLDSPTMKVFAYGKTPAGLFIFRGDKFDGPAIFIHPNGQPRLLLTFENNIRIRTVHWNEAGQPVLYYQKNWQAGRIFTCLCKEGRPFLMQEIRPKKQPELQLIEWSSNGAKSTKLAEATAKQKEDIDAAKKEIERLTKEISREATAWKPAFETWKADRSSKREKEGSGLRVADYSNSTEWRKALDAIRTKIDAPDTKRCEQLLDALR